ncbi:MAG: sialidase family protein [Chthoniobacterales bacterium]
MKKLLICLLAIQQISTLTAREVKVSDEKKADVNKISEEAVVVDGGLWPNLALLPNGEILLSAFNSPKHGGVPGDIDAWKSSDDGATWEHFSTVAKRPHEASNRMNHAVGVIKKDSRLVAVVWGYEDTGKPRWTSILPIVTTSTDNGKTWEELGEFDCGLSPQESVIPYGQMVEASDGSLRFIVYVLPVSGDKNTMKDEKTAYMVKSTDDGKTWSEVGTLGSDTSETATIEVAPKEWLAITRTKAIRSDKPGEHKGMTMEQLRSTDDGKTWINEGTVTSDLQHPANLLITKNGDLLLTYSDRIRGETLVRLSKDKGKSWGRPYLVNSGWGRGDGGYPSTVQLSDGTFVTAFYAARSPLVGNVKRYHTGLVRWQLP